VASLVLGASLALGMSPAAAKIDRIRSDGWTLKVRHDPFTGEVRCALAAPHHHMLYQPGAIGFRFGKRRDTQPAWYRVDGGVAVRWQDRMSTLVGAGVALDGPGLDNPTGGWVWIPLAEVEQAHSVAIRARNHGRVRTFRLAGFDAMLAGAKRSGCGADDAFRI